MAIKHTSPMQFCLTLVFWAALAVVAPATQAEPIGPGVAFHLDSDADANLALRRVAMQLKTYPDVPIHIVLIGSGVRPAIEGATDQYGGLYSAQIEQLLAEGVRIFACENTMDSIKITQDDLAFGIETVRSGIAELTRLQLEKRYAYIKL